MNHSLRKFKPAVSKKWLIASAGLMWSAVGILLCRLAYHWLAADLSGVWMAVFGGCGLAAAVGVYYFGFSKIAKKNIDRLCLFPEKVCFFAFQAWKSYLLILLMIGMGYLLRHYLIRKEYLAVVYIAIGGALFLSSFHYYGTLWRLVVEKKECR
ncbi:MAG: hypothetical protein WA081_20300 [Desulfosalsimonadaceae bacterium]